MQAAAALGLLGLGGTLAACSSSSTATPAAASTMTRAVGSTPCDVRSGQVTVSSGNASAAACQTFAATMSALFPSMTAFTPVTSAAGIRVCTGGSTMASAVVYAAGTSSVAAAQDVCNMLDTAAAG